MGLPTELFPIGARTSTLIEPSEMGTRKEAGVQSISWNNGNGVGTYTVSRFGTIENSKIYYQWSINLFSSNAEEIPDFNFTSKYANEFKIGCEESEFGGYWCSFKGRYLEYVMTFSTLMDEDMTYKRFIDIVEYIDEQMGCRIDVKCN